MWFIGVEVQQETSAPPPKKNPGSAPVLDFICRMVLIFILIYFGWRDTENQHQPPSNKCRIWGVKNVIIVGRLFEPNTVQQKVKSKRKTDWNDRIFKDMNL